jgi:hypothetical protein
MKVKSFFTRIPSWIVVLVVLAIIVVYVFNNRAEGFASTCYSYYLKSGKDCISTKKYGYSVPENGYKDSKCKTSGGNSGQSARYCM